MDIPSIIVNQFWMVTFTFWSSPMLSIALAFRYIYPIDLWAGNIHKGPEEKTIESLELSIR